MLLSYKACLSYGIFEKFELVLERNIFRPTYTQQRQVGLGRPEIVHMGLE